MDPSEQPVTGAAQRRKQRRLRSWWRHEQQSIAAALATFQHHSSRGQKTARAGEEESETKYTAKFRTHPPPQAAGVQHFVLDDDEPGGSRPDRIASLSAPQEAGSAAHCGADCRRSPSGASFRRSCVADSGPAGGCHALFRLPSVQRRLSKCPRSCSMTSQCAPLCAIPSWRHSWWKCRRSYPIPGCSFEWSRPLTFQFLVVEGEFLVFKVFFGTEFNSAAFPGTHF